jgi:ankyrin repeat protein
MGNMDDVVIDVKTNETKVSFAIQLKHKEDKNKRLLPATLEAENGDFSLKKYCESFKSLSDMNKRRQFILYTNAKFDPKRTGEVTNFTMIQDYSCDGNMFFNTSSGEGNVYRFEVNDKTPQDEKITKSDYETFFSQLKLFVCQKNYIDLKQDMVKILRNDTIDIVPKYLELFRNWHQGNFTNKKIDKMTVNIHLIDIFLSPFIVTNRHLPVNQNEKFKLFEKVIKEFDVTLINDTFKNFTENLSDDFNPEEGIEEKLRIYKKLYNIGPYGSADECIMRLAKEIKIIDKSRTVLENKVKLKVLQYVFEKPIIVNFNENSKELIYKIMELHQLGGKIKFILVGQRIQSNWLSRFRIFENINDLSKMLYSEVTRTCRLSLQGRKETTLEEMIYSSKEICEHVGANEVFQMLKGKFLIGQATKNPSSFYIKRKISFKVGKIDEFFDDTFFIKHLAVVKFDKEMEKIQNEIRKCKINVVDVQDYLMSTQISNKPTIISTNEECSKQLLEDVKEKSDDKTAVYLRISKDNGSLIISIEENQIQRLTRPVNILCADPGMGKTTMLKKLRNECESRFWTIDVDLKTYDEFFKSKHDVNEILNSLIGGNKNTPSFLTRIRNVFWYKRKVYFFFDGLDEVEKSCLDNLLHFIKELSSEGFPVWISSRKNLKTKLENHFCLAAMDMEEVEEEQQRSYIKNRLKEGYNHEQIENIISNIFNSSVINNLCQVLGNALQLYIITQNFLSNKELHQKMTEYSFIFTKMYDLFFRERFKNNRDKEESKNPHLALAGEEDILEIYEHLAVHSSFSQEVFEKLNANMTKTLPFLNQIKTNKDILGIITQLNDEGKAVFEHFTYREYFAARYFVNNFDKARLIREELFSDGHKNLMKILSVILAEDNPLHLAVIYGNVDQIAKYINDENVYDKAGRNPLHLATFIEPRCVDRKSCLIEDSTEAREYLTNIGILKKLVKFNYADCDNLFQWNALKYAFENKNLIFVEMFLKICDFSKEKLNQHLKNYINYDNLVPFYLTHGCIKLLSSILESSDKNKNYFKENASIIIEHTIKNCYFQENETLRFVIETLQHDYDFFVDSKNKRGETVLHFGAKYGKTYAVEMLLEKGASVNIVTANNKTPLDLARDNGHGQIATLLTDKTPKHYLSISRETVKTNRLLTEKRTSLNEFENDNKFQLHLAASSENVKRIKLSNDEGGIAEPVTKIPGTPLNVAALRGNLKTIELLIEKGASVNAIANESNDNQTPLHWAAKSRKSETAKLLIEKGAHVNAPANDNVTSLHIAAQSGNLETVALLIEQKADLNALTTTNQTPLHWATKNKNPEIAKLLIKEGATVAARTTDDQTPLHWAVKYGISETVTLLIEKGAFVNYFTTDSQTPLHWAVKYRNSETVALLIEKGASVNASTVDNQTPLHWIAQSGNSKMAELLIENRALVDAVADNDITPLHLAAQSGNSEIVALLIEKGASASAPTIDNETPLHVAAQHGNAETVALLITKNASVNARTKNKATPLHMAAISKNSKTVELLIENKASVNDVATDNQTPLHWCAIHGDLKTVALLIEKGASVNALTTANQTPLHWAAQSGNVETVKLLIEKGASVNAFTTDNKTPLHWAVRYGNSETVALLIQNGAFVNALTTHNLTPLHCAVQSGYAETVELLIEKGASINTLTNDNQTSLHFAAMNEHSKIVELLIEKGASVNALANDNQTPLHWAADCGNSETVALLIEKGAFVDAFTTHNQTPLHCAAQNGNAETVELLIEKGAFVNAFTTHNQTPLHCAAQSGKAETVVLLIDKGASVNALANDNQTPLHCAAINGNSETVELLIGERASVNALAKDNQTPLHWAVISGNTETVELLIENEASVNDVATDNQTPLHWAAKYGNKEIVGLLIDKGAFVSALANDNQTPLHWAAVSGNSEIVELLIKKGASVNDHTTDIQTPIHWAAKYGNKEIVGLLIDKGASVNALANDCQTPLHWAAISGNSEIGELLIQKKASVHGVTIDGQTPLHWAAKYGNSKTVELLIKKGASVNAATTDDQTPLHWAAKYGNTETVALLIENGAFVTHVANDNQTPLHWAAESGNSETVALLMEKGASVNAMAKENKTPLHRAAECGNSDTARLLIEGGASVNAFTIDHQTPLHWAAKHGNLETVALLIEKGASVTAFANDNQTPLHWAAECENADRAKLLIQKGASVETVTTDNETPLHWAAKNRNSKTAILLIEKGASVNALTTADQAPLHWAAQSGNLSTASLLIEKGASVNAQSKGNETPLHWAAKYGNSKTVQLLIEKGASVNALTSDNQTPLHWAAQSVNSKTAKLLIEKGASVNAPSKGNETPLHWAAKCGVSKTVKLLIDKGALVDALTTDRKSPLYWAADCGYSEIVNLLIDNGAPVA